MHPSLARLPNPGAYANTWKRVLAASSDTNFQVGWPFMVKSRDAYLRDFRDALDRRITGRGGNVPTGRKHDYLYQTELMRDARDLENHLTQRVRIYRFRCPEMNKRFGHLLADPND